MMKKLKDIIETLFSGILFIIFICFSFWATIWIIYFIFTKIFFPICEFLDKWFHIYVIFDFLKPYFP